MQQESENTNVETFPQGNIVESVNIVNRNIDKKPLELSDYAPEAQSFTLNPKKKENIRCTRGTKISVPPKAFVFADGRPVTSPVTLNVREFYDKSEYVLAGLATKSGDKMLESGGMLHIEAFADGQALEIAEGKSLGLIMPGENTQVADSENMILFVSGESDAHTPPADWQTSSSQMSSTFRVVPSSLLIHKGGAKEKVKHYRGEWDVPFYQVEMVDLKAEAWTEGFSENAILRKAKHEPKKSDPNFETCLAVCDTMDLPKIAMNYRQGKNQFEVKKDTYTTVHTQFARKEYQTYDTVVFALDVWGSSVEVLETFDPYEGVTDAKPADVRVTPRGEFSISFNDLPIQQNAHGAKAERDTLPYLANLQTFTSEPNADLGLILRSLGNDWQRYKRMQDQYKYRKELTKEGDHVVVLFSAVVRTTKYQRNLRVVDHSGYHHYLRANGEERVEDLINKYSYLEDGRWKRMARSKSGELKLDMITQPNAKLHDSYISKVSTMGWINCDRFYDVPQEDRTNLFVEAETPVQMIFTRINSVLRGQHGEAEGTPTARFTNVPKGERVFLYSLKEEQNQLYLALKETTTGTDQTPLVYEPVTEEELLERLKVINTNQQEEFVVQ
ncbi:MAG: hypothetical protein AAF740_13845, partial [Bacteroidota bacterium]